VEGECRVFDQNGAHTVCVTVCFSGVHDERTVIKKMKEDGSFFRLFKLLSRFGLAQCLPQFSYYIRVFPDASVHTCDIA